MTSKAPFEYPASLEKYAIPEKEFLAHNPQYHILCSGATIFNEEGKMLLVQRAKEEHAFPNFWIPGGKVDDTDETILHAVAREVKEETGLEVTKFVRMVGEFGWEEISTLTKQNVVWQKLIFEVEVSSTDIKLDPIEHQDYLFATEEEIAQDKVGQVELSWITPVNKELNLESFKQRRQVASGQS